MDNEDIISLGSSDEEEPKEKCQPFPVIVSTMSLRKPITEIIKRKIAMQRNSNVSKKIKLDPEEVKMCQPKNVKDVVKMEKDIIEISPIKCSNAVKNNNIEESAKTEIFSKTVNSLKESVLFDTVIDITDDSDDPKCLVISPSKTSIREEPVNTTSELNNKSESTSTFRHEDDSTSVSSLTSSDEKTAPAATEAIDSNKSMMHDTEYNNQNHPTPITDNETSSITVISPIFTEFLNVLREADRDEKTELIINNKLIKYYKKMDATFAESEEFCALVKDKTKSIESNPKICFSYVNDVLEFMKRSKPDIVKSRKNKQVKKLEYALQQCMKKVQELENAELDFEEEENSTYIQMDLYHRRSVKIHKMICELTNQNSDAGRAINWKIAFSTGKYPQIDRAVQNFVYKTKQFPDFHDVLKCVQKCNQKFSLKLSNDYIDIIARDTFTKVGKELKRRRQNDYYESVSTMLGTSVDPASDDIDLKNKLEQNKNEYCHKEQEIISRYVNLENELKLVPEEVAEDEEDISDNDISLISNN